MKPYLEIMRKLDNSELLVLIFIIFLLLFSTILETIGISLLLPLFNLLLNGENLNFLLFSNFFNSFQNSLDRLFTNSTFSDFQILSSLILLLFLIKSVIFTISNFISLNFYKKVELNLNNRLFSSYLSKEYEFFVNKNSSELIRNINQCAPVINGLRTIISLVAEFIIIAVLLVLLLKILKETS